MSHVSQHSLNNLLGYLYLLYDTVVRSFNAVKMGDKYSAIRRYNYF